MPDLTRHQKRSASSPWFGLSALMSALIFVGVLSCNSDSNQNPSTLWVGFGQTELDLLLTPTQPPFY